jgi:hypothetical protein
MWEKKNMYGEDVRRGDRVLVDGLYRRVTRVEGRNDLRAFFQKDGSFAICHRLGTPNVLRWISKADYIVREAVKSCRKQLKRALTLNLIRPDDIENILNGEESSFLDKHLEKICREIEPKAVCKTNYHPFKFSDGHGNITAKFVLSLTRRKNKIASDFIM